MHVLTASWITSKSSGESLRDVPRSTTVVHSGTAYSTRTVLYGPPIGAAESSVSGNT